MLLDFKRTALLFSLFFKRNYFYNHKPRTVLFNSSFFLLKHVLLTLGFTLFFSVLIHSKTQVFYNTVQVFYSTLLYVGLYFLSKRLLAIVFYRFVKYKAALKEIEVVTTSYLVSVMLVLYPIISYALYHINSLENVQIVMGFLGSLLLLIRAFIMLVNNKNLMSGQLLYFILYLCTLEIIPFMYIISATYRY